MLKNHSSLSSSPTKHSPTKSLFKMGSSADLHSSPKKAKKYSTIAASTATVKAHPAAIFTEGKVWDMEMQSVADVETYFIGINVKDIDVGMVKKLWQLLRNESMMYLPLSFVCGPNGKVDRGIFERGRVRDDFECVEGYFGDSMAG